MPLSEDKRKRLTALAKEMDVDPAELIAEAEKLAGSTTAPSGSKPNDKPAPPDKSSPTQPTPAAEQPKLFMYHLPFVTVNEVRTKWLGLDAWSNDEGGDDIASAFAAANTAPTGAPPADPTGLPVTPDDATRISEIIGRSKPRRRFTPGKVTVLKP
jgi:hypothetical protein